MDGFLGWIWLWNKDHENKVVDTLSRCIHLMDMTKIHFDLLYHVKESQNNDSYYLNISDKLEKYDPLVKYFKDGFFVL